MPKSNTSTFHQSIGVCYLRRYFSLFNYSSTMRLFAYFVLACLLSNCTSTPTTKNVSEEVETVAPTTLDLLIGTYTGQGSDGIYSLLFNLETGKLDSLRLMAKTTNPSYLAISKDRSRVFTVNETQNGGVSSFAWNKISNELELISEQPSEGDYPCYAALNADESLFTIGNYITGNVLAYQLNSGGVIAPSPTIKQHVGTGANPDRQEGPHAHCTIFSKDNNFLYAVDLGIDQVLAYQAGDETLGEASVALQMDAGDGPRHLIFHPTKNMAFVINELSGTVVSASIDTATGQLTKISKASTLPDDFEGENSCADIHISNDGNFLYASNRGHNSIAIFSVSSDGSLKRIANESVRGDWPRNFTLSPDNRFLLVANQRSNNIVVFERNAETGLLSFTGTDVSVSQPVCLKF